MEQVVVSASKAMNGAGTTISMKEGNDWIIKYEHMICLHYSIIFPWKRSLLNCPT
jgi:hypothetical protein